MLLPVASPAMTVRLVFAHGHDQNEEETRRSDDVEEEKARGEDVEPCSEMASREDRTGQ
jgi:hypothetical protein